MDGKLQERKRKSVDDLSSTPQEQLSTYLKDKSSFNEQYPFVKK